MNTNRAKLHKRTSVPFSFEVADGRLLVSVNLPLRRTAIVVGMLVGSPLVAELVKSLLNLR